MARKRNKTTPSGDITKNVVDVLRSLNLVDDSGQPVATQAIKHTHHVSQGFNSGKRSKDAGASLDSALSQDSLRPLDGSMPINQNAFAQLAFGPVEQEKSRVAASDGAGFGAASSTFGGGGSDLTGIFNDPMMSTFSDPFINNNQSTLGFSMSRANPYMVNRQYGSGMYGDIPVYFMMMQEQNGGLLYWPINNREKLNWLRYFVRTDPFVGAAIDLHTDMPLSRIGFSMPKLKNDPGRKKATAAYKKVKQWADKVNLFDYLLSAFHEFWVIGNVYSFCEFDNEKKWWKRITILPPEEVSSIHFPFSEFAFAVYRPEPLVRLVFNVSAGGEHNIPPIDRAIYARMPKDMIASIQRFGAILMDTDPFSGNPGEPCGSFLDHIARRRSSYQEQGVSVLERVIVPLLQKEHFKYTQLSLASRLMTPRNKINAPGVSPEVTDFLRTEVDMSMEDPDYHIVTNFDFSWDTIGAQDRLIQLQPEYERIEGEILAALGVTKELVTGEASYGGTRITLDILNTRYLMIREVFQNFIEKKLLLGMAIANDWYEIDEETGEKEYYYPKITFNRLSLQDNAEVFDALFQLYQKGSLPIKVIYEMFNLDPEEMNDLLTDDLFTPRDSTFNELLREVHTKVAEKLVEETDVKDKIVKVLGLQKVDDKGKPEVGNLQDVGTGVFAPPEEEAEGLGMAPAPEEGMEMGLPPEGEAPGAGPVSPEMPGEETGLTPEGETPPTEEGAPEAAPEEGLAPGEEIAMPAPEEPAVE